MTGPTPNTGATRPPPSRRDRQRANRDDWQQQHLERELSKYRSDFDYTLQQLAGRARRWAGTRGPKRRAAL